MPDNNAPWTPDDAFWNEGWADMEVRLDRKRRWRTLLPLLLLLTGLGAGALVLGYLPTPGTPAEDPPRTAEEYATSPVTVDDAPAVATAPEEETIDLAGGGGGDHPALPSRQGSVSASRPGKTTQPARQPAAPATSPAPAPAAPQETPAYENAGPVAAPYPAPERMPTPPLATLELLPLAMTDGADGLQLTPRPGKIVPANTDPSYALALGSSVAPEQYRPGGYLQVDRNFRRGRWFVPLSLRYDYTRREVPTERAADPRELFSPSSPVLSGAITYAGGGTGAAAQRIQTHTVSLRGGAGLRSGDRLAFSTGLEAGYLLGGSGPYYSATDSSGTVLVTVEERDFRRSTFGNNANFDLAAGGGSPPPPLNASMNRIRLSAWMRTDYRLSGNIHFTLGYTYDLNPLYRENLIPLRPHRLEAGLLFGW